MRKAKVRDIPLIESLRKKLGVGTPGDKESREFRRVVTEFRRDYKAVDGTPGTAFVDWRSRTDQDALRRMADEFLEKRGWGPRFWPDTAGSASVKRLKWSEDHIKIKKYISQLLFRHNQQTRWKGPDSPSVQRMLSRATPRPIRTASQGSTRTTRTTTARIRDITMNEGTDRRQQDGYGTNVVTDIFVTQNPYRVPSSPIRPSEQISVSDDPVDETSDVPRQDPNSVSGPANEGSSPAFGPVAPVALMTEHAAEGDLPFGTADHEMGDDFPRLDSPVLSEQVDVEFRPSPELGVPHPSETELMGSAGRPLQNSRPSSISAEEVRLSTEDRILSGEAEEPIRAMPPPPPPRPSPRVNNTQRRISIKYEVQRSRGTLRQWDHRGAFNHMSMEEFQNIHNFYNIDSVQFILKRRGMSWDDVVVRGNEDGFNDMRTRLKEKIKEDLAEIGHTQEVVLYSIVIIPIRRGPDADLDFVRDESVAL